MTIKELKKILPDTTIKKSKYGVYIYKNYGDKEVDKYRINTSFISYNDLLKNDYVLRVIETI